MKRTINGILVIYFSLFLKSCNSVEPPLLPDDDIQNTIILTKEWQELNTIAVKWKSADKDTLLAYTYRLKRIDPAGNEFTKNFTLINDDTTYIDDNDGNGLTEGTTYSYKIEAIENSKLKDTSNTITAKTLTPTSHNITWQIDTLGQQGDFLYDVWGLDENNVWAVGAVNLSIGFSGIIKWNGTEWIPFQASGGLKRGIFGFDDNNIIVVGESINRGFIGIWNGNVWREFGDDYFLANGDTVYPLYSVWGSCPEDVWAVGEKGTIIHWDGNEWQRTQSPTNLILYDVWGTSKNNVYAIHISLSQQSRLIRYDGNSWIDITNQLPIGERDFTSLWFDRGGTGYVVGNNVLFYDGSVFNRIEINQDKFLLRVRGRNSTDVFTVGQKGRVHHFNGIDWTYYPELFDESPGMELRGVHVTETTVFAVGIINNGSIIYRGVKQ